MNEIKEKIYAISQDDKNDLCEFIIDMLTPSQKRAKIRYIIGQLPNDMGDSEEEDESSAQKCTLTEQQLVSLQGAMKREYEQKLENYKRKDDIAARNAQKKKRDEWRRAKDKYSDRNPILREMLSYVPPLEPMPHRYEKQIFEGHEIYPSFEVAYNKAEPKHVIIHVLNKFIICPTTASLAIFMQRVKKYNIQAQQCVPHDSTRQILFLVKGDDENHYKLVKNAITSILPEAKFTEEKDKQGLIIKLDNIEGSDSMLGDIIRKIKSHIIRNNNTKVDLDDLMNEMPNYIMLSCLPLVSFLQQKPPMININITNINGDNNTNTQAAGSDNAVQNQTVEKLAVVEEKKEPVPTPEKKKKVKKLKSDKNSVRTKKWIEENDPDGNPTKDYFEEYEEFMTSAGYQKLNVMKFNALIKEKGYIHNYGVKPTKWKIGN